MINARAQNAYGVAHFAQQNHVPQVRWENVDIIGQYLDNMKKEKQLEMMDKNYELAKDQAALDKLRFDENVRQFNIGQENVEWGRNNITKGDALKLALERERINGLNKSTSAQLAMHNDNKNRQVQNGDVSNYLFGEYNKGLASGEGEWMTEKYMHPIALKGLNNLIGTGKDRFGRDITAYDIAEFTRLLDIINSGKNTNSNHGVR